MMPTQNLEIMKLSKISNGHYEGTETVGNDVVTCEATSQSYGGFSYTVRVNGYIVDSEGYRGLTLGSIKTVAGSYMVADAIIESKNRF